MSGASKVLTAIGAVLFFVLPLPFIIPYVAFALYYTYGGWPLLLSLPLFLMKFLVFPFFIPFIIAWIVQMYRKLGPVPYGRALFTLFLSCQLSALYQMEPFEANDLAEWGLQGKYKDEPIPSMGVWYFQGLPLGGFIDFSHCEWYGKSRTAQCYMPGLISYPKDGHNIFTEQKRLGGAKWLDITADAGEAGPPIEVFADIPPWYANLAFWFYQIFVKNRIDFVFNEKGDEAVIMENVCLLDIGLCTPMTGAAYFRTFMMHKHSDGYWDRGTYYNEAGFSAPTALGRLLGLFSNPPIWAASKTPRCGGTTFPTTPLKFGDGYRLAPVMLPGKGINSGNLKKVTSITKTLVIRKGWFGSKIGK